MLTQLLNRLFCLLLILFSGLNSLAQSYSFTSYSVDDGLPYIQVYALYQDSKGYLWSGGYGGLSYFDGKKFTTFSTEDGLPNHWVNSITEDKKGNIWIATIEGLCYYTYAQKKFTVFKTENGLPGNFVNSVFVDARGRVWAGTENGVCFYDGQSLKKIAGTEGSNVQCVYMDGGGFLWAGTSKGLMKFSDTGALLKKFTKDNGLPNENITVIKQDLKGQLVIGTKGGLVVLDEQTNISKIYTITTGLFDPIVNTLLIDRRNNYWIGTNSNLVKFDGQFFSYLSLGEDANSNKIASLNFDYEHNIWIGTYNGLYKFRGDVLVNFGPQDGLKNPFIYKIAGGAGDSKWIGTEQAGVYLYDGTNFKNYTFKDGMGGKKATAILPLDEQRVLIGTESGLSLFLNKRFKNYSTPNGFNLVGVNTLFKDSKGRIWAGSKNGLAYLTDNGGDKFSYTYFTIETNTKEYDVWGFGEDANGNIWIGTYLGGLYKYDGKTIKKFESAETKKSGSVLEIAILEGKHFFSATLEGVLYMNLESGKTTYIDHKKGLNSDLVYALMISHDKKFLWAGTNQGINRINLQAFLENEKVELVTFGKTEGLRGVESNTGGFYEDKKGMVWIGTVDGLARFNPAEYVPNNLKPKLNLTRVKLFYTDTLLANNSKLPYYLNSISFEYIGVCLTNPAKVRYMCKLDGLEKNWSPETPENFKTYSNLPPGNYTFRVKSCNNEGVWNEDALVYSFTILSPWYTSWWFVLSVIALAAAVIIFIFRIRLNQEKKRQKKELQVQIEISKNELKALRAQINPHFIFNSLNSIQHFIIENDNTEATRYLNKFAKLFRMILNNSEKSAVSIREEVDMLTIYLELEAMRFNNKFDYEFIIDASIDPDYEEMPTMLLQPYIENAILHGLTPKKEKGKLTVKITSTGSFLICTVEDNGIGRKRAGEIKTSQKASDKHKSLGMKITQDRLTLLNTINNSELSMNITDLTDKNGEPAGTRVDIYIPIN